MIEVWLGALGLALLAMALVAAGARRRPRDSVATEADTLLTDRRRELKAEAAVQGLAPPDVAALEEELALEFIDSGAPADGRQAVRQGKPALLPLWGGAAAAALLSIGLYWLWGEPEAPVLATATVLMSGDAAAPEALADLERAIAHRVERRPHDGDGWFYLAHLRMRLDDYDGATEAFAALHERTGGSEPIDLAWAQAGFLAAGGVIDEATREIVERVLGRRPDHPNMLELLAMDAIHRRDFGSAAGFLDRSLRQMLPTDRRALLEQTLSLARARLDPARPFIEVTVDVTGPGAPWLTVFARPVGARMPLAVVRRPAEASQTLILDDTVSMNAAAPLSSGNKVEVVARLSRTGGAADSIAEAVSEPVDAATQPRLRLAVATDAMR